MKKILLFVILALVIAVSASAEIVEDTVDGIVTEDVAPIEEEAEPYQANKHYITEGKCGDSVSYSLDYEGVLTVYGNGAMYVSENESCPWREYASEVREVVIKSGVKSVGRYAFSNHENLEKITVPASVEEITNKYGF